ncbi:uncharacterized protein BT62DRAFT_980425 [Guyanagaster necrorhizus]|uniref:Uncharacterized protein n=1 Tax=Guyanagaster necrorhizus TaxID=856835 RepID=A0A9P7VUF6_9AGAR|nr:uncharacterized protein BT62DRAFT_980425 [Guyanagaster necrorhizus MCA 3950]KAG7446787.1 hypothetical protein BT62DRAFT_980425 [Guyanagaster necrorhizus MCA 3950]
MSSPYNGQWTTRGGSVGSGRSSNERSSDDEQQMAYSAANHSASSAIDRPTSSSSSLSGAIGDPRILSSTSRFSGPPPGGMNEALVWPAGHSQPRMLPSQSSMYTGLTSHIPFYDPTEADVSAMGYHDYRNESSPLPSFTSPPFADTYRQYETLPAHSPSSSGSTSPQEEIRNLRRRVKELERANEQDKERMRMLQMELNSNSSPRLSTSPSFQESWRLRTEARQRQFCSLNRAGNALCAWHDSRRERRVHPPRMAPSGYLNCGCSFEEALFEESLSRHGVGSYLPGENVRMDPALRNPLLKLLQERYGYRDGDFERDPRTGDWMAGDGPEKWEQQLHSGITNPRRPRADHDRR